MTTDYKKLKRLRKLAFIRRAQKSKLAGERAMRLQRIEDIRQQATKGEAYLGDDLKLSGLLADQALLMLGEHQREEESERNQLSLLEEQVRALQQKQTRLDDRAEKTARACAQADLNLFLADVLMQALASDKGRYSI